jgi:hypothetical protein
MTKELPEMEFGKWLEDCVRDGREKLRLEYDVIAFKLIEEAKSCILEELRSDKKVIK